MKAITEQDVIAVDVPGGIYTTLAELLPPGFPYQESHWENDDRSLDVLNVSGSVWCRVFERGKEVQIAYAHFAADGNVVRCDDVHVDERHRKKGIATFLYRLAASLFEAPIVPSNRLLNDGERFWHGRTQIVC